MRQDTDLTWSNSSDNINAQLVVEKKGWSSIDLNSANSISNGPFQNSKVSPVRTPDANDNPVT